MLSIFFSNGSSYIKANSLLTHKFMWYIRRLFMGLEWRTGSGGGWVAKSCPTLAAPWTVAHQAPLSMGFSRQEYWSGLPCPSLGDLPDPGLLHCSFLTNWAMREALNSGLSFKDACVLVSILGRQHTPSPTEQTYSLLRAEWCPSPQKDVDVMIPSTSGWAFIWQQGCWRSN